MSLSVSAEASFTSGSDDDPSPWSSFVRYREEWPASASASASASAMSSSVRLLLLESAKKVVRDETCRMVGLLVSGWNSSPAKFELEEEEVSNDVADEFAVAAVAKEESKVSWTLDEEVAAVPGLFLVVSAFNSCLIFAVVEDDRRLMLVLLSLDLLLAAMMKDVILFQQYRWVDACSM